MPSKYEKKFKDWTGEELVDEFKLLRRVVGGRCFGVSDARNLEAVIGNLKERGLLVNGRLLPKRSRLK